MCSIAVVTIVVIADVCDAARETAAIVVDIIHIHVQRDLRARDVQRLQAGAASTVRVATSIDKVWRCCITLLLLLLLW